jgi:hypothetical protein
MTHFETEYSKYSYIVKKEQKIQSKPEWAFALNLNLLAGTLDLNPITLDPQHRMRIPRRYDMLGPLGWRGFAKDTHIQQKTEKKKKGALPAGGIATRTTFFMFI